MILLVGLGNPGTEYERNRHNIGFMALDAIARRHKLPSWRPKFQGDIAEGTVAGIRVVALKPRTYMNESGRSVATVAQFFKIAAGDIIVLHDELDLAPSKLKVKTGGGHAGHNGLRSIEAHVGADFHRVRLGIGHPGAKELVHHWVLGDFAKADADWLGQEMDAIAASAGKLVEKDFTGFMNDVALAMNPQPVRPVARPQPTDAGVVAVEQIDDGPTPTARNAMAETLRGLLAAKKPPGRRP
jgi:PTH1 family peptidyl-tRNA hydrolase